MRASLRPLVILSAAGLGLVAHAARSRAEEPIAAATASATAAAPSGSASAAAPPTPVEAPPVDAKDEPKEAPPPAATDTVSEETRNKLADEVVTTPVEEKRVPHGSQVSSSEWLPITIGGGAGLIAGVVIGAAIDPSQPVVFGPIVGGVAGALAGGAGGGWLIRGLRGQDTRVAGAFTGLGVGLGFGASLAAHTDSIYGKISALVLFPAAGALAGHRLAIVLGSPKKEARRLMLTPTAAPTFGDGGRATGVMFGFTGVVL